MSSQGAIFLEKWLERAVSCPNLVLFHEPRGMLAIELVGFNGVCTKSGQFITEADCEWGQVYTIHFLPKRGHDYLP